MIFSLLYEGNE